MGGRRLRALLAVLLLYPNGVVPADRLIDELWSEDAPDRAAASLRVNVSRLRKALPQDVLTFVGATAVFDEDDALHHRIETILGQACGASAVALPSQACGSRAARGADRAAGSGAGTRPASGR